MKAIACELPKAHGLPLSRFSRAELHRLVAARKRSIGSSAGAQRKLLEPNDFETVDEVARTLNAFERHWNEVAEPFDWNFTRDDLGALMERLAVHEPELQLAA